MTIPEIAEMLNQRAVGRPFGNLQQLRKALHNNKKLASQHAFRSGKTVTDHWACHYGSRSNAELQFNIGLEDDGSKLRYGVAFSIETSQALTDLNLFLPKLSRFNNYLKANTGNFDDLRMWRWDPERSATEPVSLIPSTHFRNGTFLFMGTLMPIDQIDADPILDLFERLLPLFVHVESDDTAPTNVAVQRLTSTWKKKLSHTTMTPAQRELNVRLLHNDLQASLYRQLADKYGEERVDFEVPSVMGGRVDLALRQPDDSWWYYEIKTARSARTCIREALGQLLEYAHWPGSQKVTRLIVAGKPKLDDGAAAYIATLRKRFKLPIKYIQIQ